MTKVVIEIEDGFDGPRVTSTPPIQELTSKSPDDMTDAELLAATAILALLSGPDDEGGDMIELESHYLN